MRIGLSIASCLLLSLFASPAAAQNYCLAANPNDSNPDDAALQSCLNGGGYIHLSAGSPGYILEDGLRLRVNGTTFSSDYNNRALLVADPGLSGEMLRAEADEFDISYLVFDGNRLNRTTSCSYPNGTNLILIGDDFSVRFTDSIFARCGSGLEVAGAGFEIYSNLLAHNGWSADERNSEWADGITIHRCDGGSVHDNLIGENTDIGLVVNEGAGCSIRWNYIWNSDRYAFAGMHVSAGYAGGDHGGALYSDNEIDSGYEKMSFGLVVGAHQWHGTSTADVGSVEYNDIAGAVVNLYVDGVSGGQVVNNAMSGAQGTRGMGLCSGLSAVNFAVAHNGSLTLQSGGVSQACH